MSQIHSHDRVLHACTCTWHFIQVISYQFGRYLFEYYLRHKDDKTCGDWQHKNGLARWGAKFHDGNTTQHNKDAALRWWPRHSSFCYRRPPTISRNKRYLIVWYNVSLNQSYKAIPLPSTGKMTNANCMMSDAGAGHENTAAMQQLLPLQQRPNVRDERYVNMWHDVCFLPWVNLTKQLPFPFTATENDCAASLVNDEMHPLFIHSFIFGDTYSTIDWYIKEQEDLHGCDNVGWAREQQLR